MRLSIIINNYNYGSFVGQAINSALAVDWSDKEIIVADDGSTDHSREVIISYGSKIIPSFLTNGGQNSACNAAFERSSGDIIIFLDADDVLFPSVADTLRSAWCNRIAKLQWSLAVTDENLKPTGRSYPRYRTQPTPEWVRRTLLRTGGYPFSPTSGGAWARSFLRQVLPLPVREGIDQAGQYDGHSGCQGDFRIPNLDHYLSKLAPFFGDVMCISHHHPQGAYRLHDNNSHSHLRAESFQSYAYRSMEAFECARQVNKLLSRLNIAYQPINIEQDENAMTRQLVCQRLKLHPRLYATLPEVLWKYWRSVSLSDAPIARKMKWVVWSLLVACGTKPVSLWAIRQRRHGP
jgi:glycosyltransferase involved in cell wall biosynthesis